GRSSAAVDAAQTRQQGHGRGEALVYRWNSLSCLLIERRDDTQPLSQLATDAGRGRANENGGPSTTWLAALAVYGLAVAAGGRLGLRTHELPGMRRGADAGPVRGHREGGAGAMSLLREYLDLQTLIERAGGRHAMAIGEEYVDKTPS